ncbi:hypothetical protein [Tahibacter amnicola]|uniref:DUF4402 domain-containing protein n=1 Tax=Tahibacter amnicola TaxID=2976241 RepID=A0ABY6BCF8_9GAMM|nr:hypothetical protein [Tahibacter amnicola]UXI67404.1 hypothetical protein N4264_22130 [Tahibacter amnicola]
MLALSATALAIGLATASPQGMPLSGAIGAVNHGPTILTVPQQVVHLEPITVQELIGNAAQPQPTGAITGDFDGSAIVGRGQLNPPPLPTVIRRPLRGLWRMSTPGGAMRQERVKVEIEGIDGSPGVLTADDGSQLKVPVAVTEMSPRAVATGPNEMALEGGIVLEIPTAALTNAAHYRGRLVIRIEGY